MSSETPGDIIAGHAVAMDSSGDLYVGRRWTVRGCRSSRGLNN